MHPALGKGAVAVVTGGASGIGLAAIRHLAGSGLRLCIVDLPGHALDKACSEATAAGASEQDVIAVATDVADPAQLHALADRVFSTFGQVNLLMNNAGIHPGSSIFNCEAIWDRILDVNLMGVIRSSQIFGPRMIASGLPGLIVNTGSKQGITTPPGDAAYNVSKAGVKVFTEALQHTLRNTPGCQTEARLFIPGFVFTPHTAHGRTEKPAGAWTAEQTVRFLFDSIEREDFYILCPDNEVSRDLDAKRIMWGAGDIVENRPPLSRWHTAYGDKFKQWIER
jgi:NAD(P)-dependent dehydrogenase (short-subunit alcohol dehydrogenase family)